LVNAILIFYKSKIFYIYIYSKLLVIYQYISRLGLRVLKLGRRLRDYLLYPLYRSLILGLFSAVLGRVLSTQSHYTHSNGQVNGVGPPSERDPQLAIPHKIFTIFLYVLHCVLC